MSKKYLIQEAEKFEKMNEQQQKLFTLLMKNNESTKESLKQYKMEQQKKI